MKHDQRNNTTFNNTNFPDASQLAIYECIWEVEQGTTRTDLEPGVTANLDPPPPPGLDPLGDLDPLFIEFLARDLKFASTLRNIAANALNNLHWKITCNWAGLFLKDLYFMVLFSYPNPKSNKLCLDKQFNKL